MIYFNLTTPPPFPHSPTANPPRASPALVPVPSSPRETAAPSAPLPYPRHAPAPAAPPAPPAPPPRRPPRPSAPRWRRTRTASVGVSDARARCKVRCGDQLTSPRPSTCSGTRRTAKVARKRCVRGERRRARGRVRKMRRRRRRARAARRARRTARFEDIVVVSEVRCCRLGTPTWVFHMLGGRLTLHLHRHSSTPAEPANIMGQSESAPPRPHSQRASSSPTQHVSTVTSSAATLRERASTESAMG